MNKPRFEMALLRLLAVLAMAASVATAANPTTSDDMGPAAFMWPEDRVWSAAADNTAPCGSVARVGNRTNFPLSMEAHIDYAVAASTPTN